MHSTKEASSGDFLILTFVILWFFWVPEVLFPFMINFNRELFTVTERANFFQVLLLTAAALAVISIWGPKTLTRDQERLNAIKNLTGNVRSL